MTAISWAREDNIDGVDGLRKDSTVVLYIKEEPMKIIIYALGKLYEQQKDKIDWSQIVALADKASKVIKKKYDMKIPIIPPDLICSLEYDFVAIFSNKFYEEIRMELIGEYFVPKEKIIPWNEVVECNKGITSRLLGAYKDFFLENACSRILDMGMSVLPNNCLDKRQLLSCENSVLDGIWSKSAIKNACLYDTIYYARNDCREYYDVIMIWDVSEDIESILSDIKDKARYVLIHTRYFWENKAFGEKCENLFKTYGKVSCFSVVEGILWFIDMQNRDCRDGEVAIYVAMHKVYHVQSDNLYIPLCLGDFQMKKYLIEKSGDNIAYLNTKINECTALYWIWKNTATEYVGMNHYRRYFYNNSMKSIDNYLDKSHILDIMQKYDIILTEEQRIEYTSVYEQIYNSIDHGLCQRGYSLIRSKIEKYQPEYLQVFDDVMNGHSVFLCNMFVTRRDILNKYCEWLFSFLLEAAKEIDVEGYDNYSQRVIGFFAERMWTVWLRRNKLKIKEQPYVVPAV